MIDRFLASRPTWFFLAVSSFHAVFCGIAAVFYGISAAECGTAGCVRTLLHPQLPVDSPAHRPYGGPYLSPRLSESFGLFHDPKHRVFEDG
jgi:hypothetical protein